MTAAQFRQAAERAFRRANPAAVAAGLTVEWTWCSRPFTGRRPAQLPVRPVPRLRARASAAQPVGVVTVRRFRDDGPVTGYQPAGGA